jgi:hypothetical protein
LGSVQPSFPADTRHQSKKSPSLEAWTKEGQRKREVVGFCEISNQYSAGRDTAQMATHFMHLTSEVRQRWAIIRLGVLDAGFDALKIDRNMEQVISHALKGSQQRLHGTDLLVDESLALTVEANIVS